MLLVQAAFGPDAAVATEVFPCTRLPNQGHAALLVTCDVIGSFDEDDDTAREVVI